MTQKKKIHIYIYICSVGDEMSTNSSKMHLGSILVNSAVCHNCQKYEKMLLQSRKVTDY